MCSYPYKFTTKDGVVYELPCGQCMQCRIDYGKNWGVRISSEAKLHDKKCFLTLTYDDEHLPENGTLVKEDVQKFLKRIRKAVEPDKLRYFCSGEYGDRFKRPHYHLVVFGTDWSDDRLFDNAIYDKQKKGFQARCRQWNNGDVFISEVNDGTARYVAKYVIKKIKGKQAPEHYDSLGIIPEFALMSRRPGIGADFCDKYSDELLLHGYIRNRGKKQPLPRYFKNRLNVEKNQQYKWEKLKQDIKNAQRSHLSIKDWKQQQGDQNEANIKGRLRK